MRILNTSLMIILTILSESFGFDLKCSDEDLSYAGVCVVNDLVVTSPDDAITSVDGNTDPSDFSFLYRVLRIKNQKVNFVPKNIAHFFPELEELEISSSSLEWIEEANIRDLINLKKINLQENKLEILEKYLFKSNTELQTINIRQNQLQFVHKDIFYYLTKLRVIDLEQNICSRSFYNDYYFKNAYNYRQDVVNQLNNYCQSWEYVHMIYERRFNEKISDLQTEIVELAHRLKTCDGNLDAALTNLRQQKLVNSNTEFTDQPKNSPQTKLSCTDGLCIAIDFKVSFANSSIEGDNWIKQTIRSLNIHQQQTLFLPQNLAEHFPDLVELSVIESGLFEIDYNVFKGLDSLVTLNLTTNKIPEIPVDTFTDLENLQQLDLSFNKIDNLHDDVFTSLKILQKLYLNNNHLTSIKIEVLQSLETLSGLFLQNNQLKFISANLLTPLTSLQSVDLSANVCANISHPSSSLIDVEATIIDNCIAPVELNCKIVKIETIAGNYNCQAENLFIEYPKTKILKVNGRQELNSSVTIFLAENQSIKFFPFQLSQQFPNLQRIEIQQSKLISLHRMDFAGFTKLTQIVMNNNNLSSISEGCFDLVLELDLLDLSSNNIISLPPKIFMRLPRLRTLLLTDNRIVRFTADFLPRKNVIDEFRVDNNQLEFFETKTIRFLRKAKLIDLTGNVCIDMKFDKSENSTRALVELSGEIDLNCSADD